jgi:DNA-binding NarL/FixJ family response regulator
MPALHATGDLRVGTVDRLPDDELERRSDELLADSVRERGRGEYPCYTRRWMEILGRRECEGIDRVPDAGGEIEAMLGAMVVNANLTRRQRMVIRWIVRGISQREIAEMMGLSEAQVSRIKHAAFERMRREGVV